MPACWSVDDCLWLLLNHKREAGEYVLVPGGVTHSSLISPHISNAPLKFRLVYGVGYRMGGWGASDSRCLWDARPCTLENYTPQKIICVLAFETFVEKINMAFKVIKQKPPVLNQEIIKYNALFSKRIICSSPSLYRLLLNPAFGYIALFTRLPKYIMFNFNRIFKVFISF